MTNPRKTTEYEGIGGVYATYPIDDSTITYSATAAGGSAAVGKAVTVNSSEVIALAADGEGIEGKLISVEKDGMATVQVGGYMTLPGGVGATLTNMKAIVGAVDGSANKGFIREVATATAAELGVQRGRIIDPSTTTAVVVCL